MKRIIAMILALVMTLSSLPMSVFAANETVDDLKNVGYTVISNEESTLAPGVTMNEVAMYDRNGDRVEMYITTSDPTVPTVQFYANYKDNQCATWGMQTLSEQVAAMEANYEEPFKIVAGLNAAYYNTTNGAPMGAFVMEGVDVSTNGDDFAFFAVLKDGTVMIGDKGEYSNYKGNIKEAIGGYHHIVKDGAIASGLDKVTKYPRQTIGITADGKVITMTADGSQAPQTIGLTIYEQAEIMLQLGCVDALHLDGGNSATFGAVREGSDSFETVNTPSGQAERAVSNTLMIVSTAVADGTFDHAVISGDFDYFLPNTSYTFSAIGVDATNAPADSIPESVTWALSDNSFGTIDENGTFVSNGKIGPVDIQMVDSGNVVGSKSISVVHPESISFGATEKTVPYGKMAAMNIVAMYNNNEVYCDANAFDWSVTSSSAGTLNGFDFTATSDESIKSAVITATYKYYSAVGSTSVTVKFGKGSEVIFDFEDGNISDWKGTQTIGEWIDAENAKYPDATVTIQKPVDDAYNQNYNDSTQTDVFLSNVENGGKIKSGNYSLGVTIDRLNSTGVGSWIYNYLYYTGETQIWRDVANGKSAVRVGMWVNLPQSATNTAFRICRTFTKDSTGKLYTNYDYMMSDYDGKKVSYNTDYAIPESGWIYVYFDLTAYDFQSNSQYNPYEDYAVNNGKKPNGNNFPAFIQFINGDKNDTMEKYTIYIDDITLDYSDVIEDRNEPIISDTKVAESVDMYVAINGQTVTNNYLSFQATVSENMKNANYTGLDYSSAKIYVDGVDMSKSTSFSAKGGVLALSNVYLVNGTHSVKFVIADIQGNVAELTKTFTVNGTATNSVVSLSGHNDGNNIPKTGSVYYIDIRATEASQIKNIVTTLQLNSANTFEYDNIITADGVSVEYEYDSYSFSLYLDITHNGSLSGETVLVSIPVRVWAWDEDFTGITAANQFATGNIPVIDIECHTVDSVITYNHDTYKNYIIGFYSEIDVATEIDNITAWHKHTAVALDDKAADCTEDGYEGRTYCEGCASVVDWGTKLEATGHDFAIADGKLSCTVCLESNTLNGLYEDNGLTYFLINGIAQTGWQYINESYYYFNKDGIGYNGSLEFTAGVTYTLTNGKLDAGVWAPTLHGPRYYYGPGYHTRGWQTINGKDYFFDNGYALTSGWQLTQDMSFNCDWYYFNEDGSCDRTIRPEDGFYVDRNGLGYSKDGSALKDLHLIDGSYYYFDYKGYAVNNGTYAGYLFKGDYKAYTGLHTVSGVTYVYDNGKKASCGLYEINGDYYYSYWGGVLKTDGTYYVEATFCDLPVGTYTFGADGKLVNGIIENNGVYTYYLNGKLAADGLYNIDGAYYFVKNNGVCVTNASQYVWSTFCDLPANTNYAFGADGKMLNGPVDVDGTLYLYINGKTATCGLYEVDGEYYYSYWGGVLKTDGRYFVDTTFCDLPALKNYTFGADGKMLDGVVDVNGTLYLYDNGSTATCGLYEVDGEYYYSYWGGVLKTDGRYFVDTTFCDMPAFKNYTFGADGKMLDGVVDVNGTLYLYDNGSTATCGLYEVDGEYYYSYWGGVLKTDGRYYVETTFCDLPAGKNYTFGADGKMLDGIVDIDGKLYMYENGSTVSCGLYKIDDAYYYVYYGGEIKTDGKYYADATFCDLAAGKSYMFGADGKMLNGLVTIDGTIYYYVNGSTPAPGLVMIDGDYYFVDWGGKVITNRTFYVYEGNGYTIPMNYNFDATGKVIL